MNPSTIRALFRTVAIAEALSWGLLLIAMFFKWILDAEPFGLQEGGVPVAGPIHGVVFMIYLGVTVAAWVVFRWRTSTGLLALVSSIPPFATVWFERKADREGKLHKAGATSVP